MAKSELSIKVMKEELEYFTGFYQESAGMSLISVAIYCSLHIKTTFIL